MSLSLSVCLSFIICSIFRSMCACACVSVYLATLSLSLFKYLLHSSFSSCFFHSFLSLFLCIYILKEKTNKRSLKIEHLFEDSLFTEVLENDTEVLLVHSIRAEMTIKFRCFLSQRSSGVNALGCICQTNELKSSTEVLVRHLPSARSRSLVISSLAKPPL